MSLLLLYLFLPKGGRLPVLSDGDGFRHFVSVETCASFVTSGNTDILLSCIVSEQTVLSALLASLYFV